MFAQLYSESSSVNSARAFNTELMTRLVSNIFLETLKFFILQKKSELIQS
jgi:hypothetical protein